jgi:hypothetical protein
MQHSSKNVRIILKENNQKTYENLRDKDAKTGI